MNRTGAVVRLFVCLLTAGILCFLLVAGINHGLGFFVDSFGTYSYDDSDQYLSGELDTEEFGEIRRVYVRWVSGSVTVVPAKDGRLSVSETGSTDDSNSMRWLIKDGVLNVQFSKPHGFSFKRDVKKQLKIALPESLMNALTSFGLEITSADAALDCVKAKRISIESVSGNVVADSVSCEKLIIETVSGDFDVSGDISDLSSESVSGDVMIRTQKAPTLVDSDSVSGDLTLIFAECSGFTVNFDKVSGDFTSDFPVYERGDDILYSNGGGHYSFDTVSGDFNIKNSVNTAAPTAEETSEK